MRLDALGVADRNAKDHDIDELRAAIQGDGFLDGLILDERTGKLVGGHGRRETLMGCEAAFEELPDGIILDADERWLVPVQRGWASVDDEQAERVGVALNGIGEKGGWKKDVLAVVLADLAKSPVGLVGTGMSIGSTVKRLSKPPSLQPKAKDLRPMQWRWFLVRVDAHRVSDVVEHIDAITAVDGVEVSSVDNGGGRAAGLLEWRGRGGDGASPEPG